VAGDHTWRLVERRSLSRSDENPERFSPFTVFASSVHRRTGPYASQIAAIGHDNGNEAEFEQVFA
jgi:hypothetical protein